MRAIFFSDTQVDFGNLQECETALDEVLASAAKYKPDVIIHAGDVKDEYSPISAEVVKFAVRMVRRIRKAGHRFIILLGNHDRISQSSESKNWLDVLAAAGAEVVTKPQVKMVAGAAVGFLPYTTVPEELKNATLGILERDERAFWASYPRIPCRNSRFRGQCLGQGRPGVTAEDLQFDQFDACLGGHIHRHQRIGDYPAWYIGSPFCQDWGEADSRHGHLLVTVKKNIAPEMERRGYKGEYDVKVKQIVTCIPHWYNIDYLERTGIQPEDGAYIRSKVRVSSKKISDRLHAEEERIRKLYGNVRIHTVPELIDEEIPDVVSREASDKEKVEQYVAATITEESRFEAKRAVAYMASKLEGLKDRGCGRCDTVHRSRGQECSGIRAHQDAVGEPWPRADSRSQ